MRKLIKIDARSSTVYNNVNILDDLFESNDSPKKIEKVQKEQDNLLDDLLSIDFTKTDITPVIAPKEENPFSIASDNPLMNEILNLYNRPRPSENIEVKIIYVKCFKSFRLDLKQLLCKIVKLMIYSVTLTENQIPKMLQRKMIDIKR